MANSNDQNEVSASDSDIKPAQPKAPVSKTGVFGLLVAILALAAAGWSGWQLNEMRNLPNAVNTATSDFRNLSRRLDQLREGLREQEDAIDDLEDTLASGLSAVSDLPLRVEQVEELVKSVPGVDSKQRSQWLRAEALYYLRIANAQAQLVGDAEVAASALTLADEKLLESGDPRMAAVREQISNELAALRAVPKLDREGISFRLQSLIGQTDEWPFREAMPTSFKPDPGVPEGEMSFTDRILGTLKSVFDSIVSVKQIDGEPLEQQLGVAERALIVENLRSELQVARLAFLANNPELFGQALQQSATQLRRYFDMDAESVTAALDMLAELGTTKFPGDIPDISASLALLQSVGESE
jgi:uroporphyrin-3 C-methyltransferase